MNDGGKRVIQRALFLAIVLAYAQTGLAVNISESGGFEIGNGAMLSHRNKAGGYDLRGFESYEVGMEGKITEVMAPSSDGGVPRTRLLIDVWPLAESVEEALNSLLRASKGWIEFTLGKFYGIHREVKVRENWNRLEVQLFRANEKFMIRLEGNKKKSRAYTKLAKSLMRDIP